MWQLCSDHLPSMQLWWMYMHVLERGGARDPEAVHRMQVHRMQVQARA